MPPQAAFHANIVTPMNQDWYRFKRDGNSEVDSIGPVFRGILPNWVANLFAWSISDASQ